MPPNASQGLYGSEYLQAANKYGITPYDPSLPSTYLAATGRIPAMADLHRQKPKPKSKHNAGAYHQHQQPPAQAQPRQEEEHDIGDGLEENYFALVSTEELEKQGLKAHPDKIAEAAALSSVSLPAGSYKLCLPAQVIQGKYLRHETESGHFRLACCLFCVVCAAWPEVLVCCRPHQCLTISGS